MRYWIHDILCHWGLHRWVKSRLVLRPGTRYLYDRYDGYCRYCGKVNNSVENTTYPPGYLEIGAKAKTKYDMSRHGNYQEALDGARETLTAARELLKKAAYDCEVAAQQITETLKDL